MNNKLSPCKDCTFETGRCIEPVNCHTYCEKYLDYCKQRETSKTNRLNEIKKANDYYAVRRKGLKSSAK